MAQPILAQVDLFCPTPDPEHNLKLALRCNFKPLFKPRSIKYRGMFRKLMLRDFRQNRKLYRMRGVGEATFGGIERRYGAHTRCKRVRTKVLSILLMTASHNLRTLMRIQAAEKLGFIFILWIFSTNPKEAFTLVRLTG